MRRAIHRRRRPKEFGEKIFEEIGAEMGISPQAAATICYKAMAKLTEYGHRDPKRVKTCTGLLDEKAALSARGWTEPDWGIE